MSHVSDEPDSLPFLISLFSLVSVSLNLDGSRSELPNPAIDWPGFYQAIFDANNREPQVWDPLSKSMSRWVKMHQLDHTYRTSSFGTEVCACSVS
jgi:hypothetical protein